MSSRLHPFGGQQFARQRQSRFRLCLSCAQPLCVLLPTSQTAVLRRRFSVDRPDGDIGNQAPGTKRLRPIVPQMCGLLNKRNSGSSRAAASGHSDSLSTDNSPPLQPQNHLTAGQRGEGSSECAPARKRRGNGNRESAKNSRAIASKSGRQISRKFNAKNVMRNGSR